MSTPIKDMSLITLEVRNGTTLNTVTVTGLITAEDDLDMTGHDILNVGNVITSTGTFDTINVDAINGKTDIHEIVLLNNTMQLGTADDNQSSQLWYFNSNDSDPNNAGGGYSGEGPIIRIGSSTASNDAQDIISEGLVAYGTSSAGGEMDSDNFSRASIASNEIQLLDKTTGPNPQYPLFIVDDSRLRYTTASVGPLLDPVLNIDDTQALFTVPIQTSDFYSVENYSQHQLQLSVANNNFGSSSAFDNPAEVLDGGTVSDSTSFMAFDHTTGELTFSQDGVYAHSIRVADTNGFLALASDVDITLSLVEIDTVGPSSTVLTQTQLRLRNGESNPMNMSINYTGVMDTAASVSYRVELFANATPAPGPIEVNEAVWTIARLT